MRPEPARAALPSDHLDMLRGLAALAVCAWHWRNLFFVDFPAVEAPGWGHRAFYFLTGFGHEAVMVFFVLSGFFIARSIRRSLGDWRWRGYALSRAVRLQVVLLPALVLGAAWDWAGLKAFGAAGVYGGNPALVVQFPVAERLDAATFFGNALFLQEILVRPFGSNGPLWSLSYEGWYYVLFPLALLALLPGRAIAARIALGAAAAGLALFVGPVIMKYFAIWLLGALVAWLPGRRLIGTAGWAAIAASGLACAAAATVSRTRIFGSGFWPDFWLGLAFAAFLAVLVAAGGPSRSRRYAAVAAALAGCSYTLYLVHMPALVFAHAALLPAGRWQPDAPHLAAGAGVLALVVTYAWGVSRVTEARTERVRAWLAERLGGGWATRRVPAAEAPKASVADPHV